MSQWVIKYNGSILPSLTLRPISVAEIHIPVDINRIDTFRALIEKRWGTAMTPPNTNEPEVKEEWKEYGDDNEYPITTPKIQYMQWISMEGRSINNHTMGVLSTVNSYFNMEMTSNMTK